MKNLLRFRNAIRKGVTQYLIASLLFVPGPILAQDPETPPAPTGGEILTDLLNAAAAPTDTAAAPTGEVAPPAEEAAPPPAEELPPPESASMSAGSSGSGGISGGADGSPNTIKQVIPEIDRTTGALIYKYPIQVPPGRNGLQPALNLSYNSLDQDPSAIVGHGWSLDIPYIRRINRKGVDKLYTEDYFESSLSGELINAAGTTYEPKVDNGEFLKYVFASSTWTVTDKTGTIYTFGSATSTRQDNPASSTQIFAWMLERVQDLNGNFITYTYYKDAGQIYPSSTIYTGFGTTTAPFEIDFNRETRPDVSLKYNTGFNATTTYRIKEVIVKYNNSWVRNYALSYATSTTGTRILLSGVTETGRTEASTTVALPATQFTYQGSAVDFISDSSWSCPSAIDSRHGVIFADADGNGLSDLIYSVQSTQGTYMNNASSTWVATSSYSPPIAFYDVNYSPHDLGVRSGDIDGDGHIDFVQKGSANESIYFDWQHYTSSSWAIPTYLASSTDIDLGSRFVDLNGDGLPDFISTTGTSTVATTTVWLNTGTSWATSTGWSAPVLLQDGTILLDLNNDGLIDIVASNTTSSGTYLNNGNKGWAATSNWAPPTSFKTNNVDQGVREADVNGDGYSDLLKGLNNGSTGAYLNLGTSWSSLTTTSWVPPAFVEANGADIGPRIVDYNGDGMVDIVDCNDDGSNDVFYKNPGVKPDLLTQVKLPTGGTVDIAYKATAQFKNGSALLNPNLPFIVDAVYTITRDSGFVTSTETMSYELGKYYFADSFNRKMAGFGKVISTNSASHTISNFYHQGDASDSTHGEYSDHVSKIGKIYRTEVRDSANNLYSLALSKWDQASTTAGNFVKRIQSMLLQYDGDSDHKDKVESYAYATTTGNLIEKIEWGEVTGSDDGTFTDTASDKRTTAITYASNTTDYVYGLPASETVTNASSTKIKESKYYYDSLAIGSVDNGNLTKEERWATSTTYIDVEKTYNNYGLVTQEKDPRDKAINYTYDANNLYPATSTNALSQSTSYTYDYSSGKVLTRKDPNTRIFTTVLDGLDRVTEEDQPNLTTPTSSVTRTTITYTDAYNGSKVLKSDHLDGSVSVPTYTYLDGFGRPIQTRRQTEDITIFVANDIAYNNLERTKKESLPYFSTNSASTTATTTASLYATYAYDPMLRITSVSNAVGTTTTAYDQWKTTITDARSKLKHLYSDAYGNLNQVDEVSASSTYTTTYEYNLNDNLTKITDALGNFRNFTYDGLGRRLTAQDLHASGDATFGTWTYAYDATSNLTQTDDPNSQTVTYTYDDLNRILTENYTGLAGTEVSYGYDSCTEGVGRLCTATSTDATVQYAYNALGGIATETKTVSSTAYQTSYTYDRQGNILTITNPDGSEIKYEYNLGGLLELILWKEQ